MGKIANISNASRGSARHADTRSPPPARARPREPSRPPPPRRAEMSLSHRLPHAGEVGDPYYVYAPPPLHPDPQRQGVLTLFIAGLPDDVKPREIHNLISHRPGFDHCLLEYTGRGN
ncbi:hypothetical protein PR202_gb17878 [Eleusine coracana subsp. coracana]|uniref:Uncharacterized protein n=1 Tax=Eleusine coracana subsp. coracana TaxID=191504 RepID=A0AAV5F417_ELECO|nr:hypothetical protein PR202_gb17878 [Eleusine coracana subsp. coracana]